MPPLSRLAIRCLTRRFSVAGIPSIIVGVPSVVLMSSSIVLGITSNVVGVRVDRKLVVLRCRCYVVGSCYVKWFVLIQKSVVSIGAY